MFADDATRIRHMLDAARELEEYTSAYTRTDLDQNRMLYHSLKDCLSTIGEAAFKITRNFKDANPQVEWRDLIGLRNELIHDYFVVDLDTMWNTATQAIPPLIAELEKLTPTDSEQ